MQNIERKKNTMERCYEKQSQTIRNEYARDIEAAMLKMVIQNQISTTTEDLLTVAVKSLCEDITK